MKRKLISGDKKKGILILSHDLNRAVSVLMSNALLKENTHLRCMVYSSDSSYYTALVQENAMLYQKVEELLAWKESASRYIAELRGVLSPTPRMHAADLIHGSSENVYGQGMNIEH